VKAEVLMIIRNLLKKNLLGQSSNNKAFGVIIIELLMEKEKLLKMFSQLKPFFLAILTKLYKKIILLSN